MGRAGNSPFCLATGWKSTGNDGLDYGNRFVAVYEVSIVALGAGVMQRKAD